MRRKQPYRKGGPTKKEYRDRILDGNRKPDHTKIIDLLPELEKLEGRSHGGCDCFVFLKNIIPKLKIGNVCVGYPPVGTTLWSAIKSMTRKHRHVYTGGGAKNAYTFHLGRDLGWRNDHIIIGGRNRVFAQAINCKLAKGIDVAAFNNNAGKNFSSIHAPRRSSRGWKGVEQRELRKERARVIARGIKNAKTKKDKHRIHRERKQKLLQERMEKRLIQRKQRVGKGKKKKK
jgi:hypothetical protein